MKTFKFINIIFNNGEIMLIENSRIKTGYDIEILLGSGYFFEIIGALYDSGEIESELVLDNNVTIQIERPSSFSITSEHQGHRNAEMVTRLTLTAQQIPTASMDVTLFLNINITASSIEFEYVGIDDNFRQVLNTFGVFNDMNNITLPQYINRAIPLNLMGGNTLIERFEFGIVSGSGDYQDACGLYINLEHSANYDYNRGNILNRLSFLPNTHSFALGLNSDSIDRIESDLWDNFITPIPNVPEILEEFLPPMRLIFHKEEVVGYFTDLSLTLSPGSMIVEVKSKIDTDKILELEGTNLPNIFPHADVTTTFIIFPLAIDGQIQTLIAFNTDVEMGLLGELLGVVIGIVTGGIVGFIFNASVGMVVGAAAGAIAGSVLVEYGEDYVGDKVDDRLEDEEEEEMNFDAIFESLPQTITWSSFRPSRRIYNIDYDIYNYIDMVWTDNNGISYAGHPIVGFFTTKIEPAQEEYTGPIISKKQMYDSRRKMDKPEERMPWGPDNPPKIIKLYNNGRDLLVKNKLEKALESFHQALESYSAPISKSVKTKAMYSKLQNYEKVIKKVLASQILEKKMLTPIP
jgi:hypothetical protein